MTCQMANNIFSPSPGARSCARTQGQCFRDWVFQDRVKQQLPTFASTDPLGSRLIPFPPRAALHTGKEQCTAAIEEALSSLVDATVFWEGGMGLVPNTA